MIKNSNPLPRVSLGLVHYPVLDRAGTTVCTNITNIDIYDISRAARTYGIERYYLINRVREQLMFASRVRDHWLVGTGARYHPSRKKALSLIHLSESLEMAINDWGCRPLVVATSARDEAKLEVLSFRELRSQIEEAPERPVFLVFGTGSGLEASVFDHCDVVLEPIRGGGPKDFRHLSVRSAVSICLDRLLGSW